MSGAAVETYKTFLGDWDPKFSRGESGDHGGMGTYETEDLERDWECNHITFKQVFECDINQYCQAHITPCSNPLL